MFYIYLRKKKANEGKVIPFTAEYHGNACSRRVSEHRQAE
jgi:hypothetical protein